jgi:hypothetical protein
MWFFSPQAVLVSIVLAAPHAGRSKLLLSCKQLQYNTSGEQYQLSGMQKTLQQVPESFDEMRALRSS